MPTTTTTKCPNPKWKNEAVKGKVPPPQEDRSLGRKFTLHYLKACGLLGEGQVCRDGVFCGG